MKPLLILAFVALALGCHDVAPRGAAGHAAPGEPATHAHGAPTGQAPNAVSGGAPAAGATGNAVQEEMRLLTAALAGAITGIGQGDVRQVAHDLHRVHGAKEATAAALADGRYRLPKNPGALERFRELDEAFHTALVPLVVASERNDVEGTARALGAVLTQCQGCHAEFRP